MIRQCISLRRQGFVISTWVSLQCRPWCPWQYVMSLSSFNGMQVLWDRKVSEDMLHQLRRFLQETQLLAALAWPRFSSVWGCASIRYLSPLLPIIINFDGYVYGSCNDQGALLYKPWKVITNLLNFVACKHSVQATTFMLLAGPSSHRLRLLYAQLGFPYS